MFSLMTLHCSILARSPLIQGARCCSLPRRCKLTLLPGECCPLATQMIPGLTPNLFMAQLQWNVGASYPHWMGRRDIGWKVVTPCHCSHDVGGVGLKQVICLTTEQQWGRGGGGGGGGGLVLGGSLRSCCVYNCQQSSSALGMHARLCVYVCRPRLASQMTS